MKASKTLTNIIAFLCIAAAGVFYFSRRVRAEAHVQKLVIVGKNGVRHDFEVEIASTPQEQELGLMFRKTMAPDHGMLFEMNRTAPVVFWMKNTLIPLDMLFVAPDGVITHVHANAVPEDLTAIPSEGPVSGVIEIDGGRAKALGIAAGDRVLHPYFNDVK
ncbi:MAG: DUF192 domain-containing protein [Alphaproteobacteria bacterium]|nr:DUF192 domain-containing protein [Alphaproteobacteria bacterium]MDE2337035.1 DUF192 domain-containing protein [Alphaproteobacteria bacterium]